ncbi:MAG: DUF5702 domain-containing protein [Coprococcus sp.]
MTERYADMAAEMVFSAYVKPLAERYDLLVLDVGENGEKLDQFENYMSMNLGDGQSNGRNFNLNAQIQTVKEEKTASVRDVNWKSLKEQIERYEKYSMGSKGIENLKELIAQLQGTGVTEKVENYSGELRSEGQAADAAVAEMEQREEDAENTANIAENVQDPRPGIKQWLKSGLLNLVMGDRSISGRSIETEQCSWHREENKKQTLLNSFDGYREVINALDEQDITKQIRQGLQEQETQLMVNLYILEKFNHLCGNGDLVEESVLNYEIEYILSGHGTDRENLEGTVAEIFTLRTLLNLAYLYTSQEKGAVLQNFVQALSILAAIPVIGQLLELLLMVCWAAAEAVVDCAALTDGKKVPLMKNDGSWNLTMEQLISIGEKGGHASDYVRDGRSGLDYGQYLLTLMLLTPSETKIIRMTQLMECNIRLIEGYEQFAFSKCAVAARFSGSVQIEERFWKHPGNLQHNFNVEYSY